MNNNSPASSVAIIRIFIIMIIVTLLIIALIFLQSLSKEAAIKSFISQIFVFDQAIESFYHKYDALPGDAVATVEFALSKTNSDGNGNGVVEDANGDIIAPSGEVVNFWLHLSNSGFIHQQFDGLKGHNAQIGTTFPISSLNSKRAISVFGYGGKNYYQIGVSGTSDDALIMSDDSLTTAESLKIDIKIDDGFPKSGSVMAVGGRRVNGFDQLGDCVVNDEYNRNITYSTCQIRIEFGVVKASADRIL
ncbi:MAG: hypothetical protein O3B09_01455 [Proteobacteria bacterium]|nr:hypothetical protein [Pseudomonadota bacterium]